MNSGGDGRDDSVLKIRNRPAPKNGWFFKNGPAPCQEWVKTQEPQQPYFNWIDRLVSVKAVNLNFYFLQYHLSIRLPPCCHGQLEDTGTATFSQSKSALAFPYGNRTQWTGDHYWRPKIRIRGEDYVDQSLLYSKKTLVARGFTRVRRK